MSVKLYVGNMSYDVTDSELNDLFTPFGTVESARIITDKFTGNSKGFGFVEMANREEANQAMNDLNGKTINNRAIVVNEARPQVKSPRGPGGGGGGGGFGGRSSRGGGSGGGAGSKGRPPRRNF
ncbi:MAG: RNA-binding protein [Nitrospirota bacterium]